MDAAGVLWAAVDGPALLCSGAGDSPAAEMHPSGISCRVTPAAATSLLTAQRGTWRQMFGPGLSHATQHPPRVAAGAAALPTLLLPMTSVLCTIKTISHLPPLLAPLPRAPLTSLDQGCTPFAQACTSIPIPLLTAMALVLAATLIPRRSPLFRPCHELPRAA